MEMASSEVEMSSCQTFNCVLNPHERCSIRGDNNNTNNNNKKNKNKNNNNVRNIHVAFEKNLNVFVRDHLDNCSSVSGEKCDDNTKAVPECSDHRLSKTEEPRHEVPSSCSSLGSDPDPIFANPGQPDKSTSKKETRAASSLVQIWEARTTQQSPSSSQNQSQIDSRTSSSGSNVLENSESLNEEPIKESELIQPIEEGNNEDEKEEEMESDPTCVPPPPPDSGEKEREGVRVMDIIRKLSNDPDTTASNDIGSSSNENGKEVQTTTEVRTFPQVACSPRIRGRQAFADLLVRMTREREKELACLSDRHSVSKFTHRGRIQSTLRIRCYERCLAIQDRHRSKSSAAGSDLNRSPRGSGVMHLLREKYKTNSENTETGAPSSSVSSRGRIVDKDPHKASEKKVVEETSEKIDVKVAQEVISAVETAKKAVLSEIVENKNGLKKSVGETLKKENAETKDKAVAKEGLEGRDERRELTKEKAIAKETAKNVISSESADNKIGLNKSAGETIQKETTDGRGEKGETKEKPSAKERVEGNALVGIAEKVNRWNSEEKLNKRRWMENGKTESKANTGRVDKNDALEEATRRIMNVESAERSITTSRETMAPIEFVEKVVRRKNREDCVSLETKSREIEDAQQVTAKEKEKVLQEPKSDVSETKNGLKNPTEKESREGRSERLEMEESVEGNSSMGIAEKVNMWNSKEKKNRRRVMDKGKGKTEGKANTERNEVLQEASRRIINGDTAERSITSSKETVEKVVCTQEGKDKRESSREITRCEPEEKGRRMKEEEFSSVGAKSKDNTEVKNLNSQEFIPEQQSACHGSLERAKEISSSAQGEEAFILRNPEAKSTKEIEKNNFQENRMEEESASGGSITETSKEKISSEHEDLLTMRNSNDVTCIKESEDAKTNEEEREESRESENMNEAAIEFVNDWDENEMEEEEEEEEDDYGDFDHYNGYDSSEWIYDISRPRSYWEELRKERYLEVLNTESDKKDICDLIQSRTVSNFLTGDLRQKIDNLMITRVQSHLGIPINQEEDEDQDQDQEEEEWVEECSARNQKENETEDEPEKTNLEAASDGCSQSSARSSTLMMSWSFRDQDIDKDHEPTASLSLPEPSVATNQSTQEMQMISDLRGQMEQLQREMLELRNSVKSCIDMQLHFQKSVTQDLCRSGSSAEQRVDTKNPLKRKCCVCSEMPVDSLLYRCGHMCTCLKCAHELQWSSKKCPICMAPIVDVVRAFLDA